MAGSEAMQRNMTTKKRKDVGQLDQVNNHFSDFSLSSPAKKISRLVCNSHRLLLCLQPSGGAGLKLADRLDSCITAAIDAALEVELAKCDAFKAKAAVKEEDERSERRSSGLQKEKHRLIGWRLRFWIPCQLSVVVVVVMNKRLLLCRTRVREEEEGEPEELDREREKKERKREKEERKERKREKLKSLMSEFS